MTSQVKLSATKSCAGKWTVGTPLKICDLCLDQNHLSLGSFDHARRVGPSGSMVRIFTDCGVAGFEPYARWNLPVVAPVRQSWVPFVSTMSLSNSIDSSSQIGSHGLFSADENEEWLCNGLVWNSVLLAS